MIPPRDLARIRARQHRLKETMRDHHVTHPEDLPLPVILAHRAVRLAGGI
jgi:hypothetical protein